MSRRNRRRFRGEKASRDTSEIKTIQQSECCNDIHNAGQAYIKT